VALTARATEEAIVSPLYEGRDNHAGAT